MYSVLDSTDRVVVLMNCSILSIGETFTVCMMENFEGMRLFASFFQHLTALSYYDWPKK